MTLGNVTSFVWLEKVSHWVCFPPAGFEILRLIISPAGVGGNRAAKSANLTLFTTLLGTAWPAG